MSVEVKQRIEAKLSTADDQLFDEELADFDAVTPTWDSEVDALGDFDRVVDGDGDLNNSEDAAHDGVNGLEITFDDNNAAYGEMDLGAANQETGVIPFWFDPNTVGLDNTKVINILELWDGVPQQVFYVQVRINGGTYQLRTRYRNDAGAITSSGWSNITDEYHKLTHMLKVSTAPGANNGWTRLYLNDVLFISQTGLDNDTRDWDTARFGMNFTNSAGFGGSFYMDTLKIDPIGGPMVDKLAASRGTYGLAIPIMNNTFRRGEFTGPTAEKTITAECWFDPNSLTMGEGDSFDLFGADPDTQFEVYLQYSGGNYQIAVLVSLDVGGDSTSYYSITDAYHHIRVDWAASTGVGEDDGYAHLFIDGVLQESLTGLDNDTITPGTIYFGAVIDLDDTTYGIFYMDDCRWGSWRDITPYVIGDITGGWGMMDNEPTTFLADTGVMSLVLNNTEEIFIPGLTGALAGWGKGTPIRLICTYDDDPYIRFYGTVDTIKVSKEPFSKKRVRVVVTDWLDYAATHPMISPAIQANQRGDEMLVTILADMPIAPLATDFDEGVNTFDTAFDTVKMKTKAYAEMAKVAVSELGPIYLRKDPIYGETLVFENAWSRHGLRVPGNTYDNNMTSLEVESGENVINRFINKANPRYIEDGVSVLFALGAPISIRPGETITIRGNYTDPSGGAPAVGANMIAPATPADYLMNKDKDGGGANLSGDLTVNPAYGAAGVVYELTNGSGFLGWIIKLQARGYLVYKYNTIENASDHEDSQDEYGIIERGINQKYQQDVSIGRQYGEIVIDTEKEPRLKVNKVNFIANRSAALMVGWLTQGIGDLVYIKETTREVDIYCFIQGIRFRISPTGLIHYTWIVKEMIENLGKGTLSEINIEQGTTDDDGIHYGYLPQISEPTVLYRSVSLWVEVTEIKNLPDGHTLVSTGIGLNGITFGIIESDPAADENVTVGFLSPVAQSGFWFSDDSTIEINTLYHLGFSFGPIDNLASNPIIYIDGLAVATTEVQAPLGDINTEEGCDFVIGNIAWLPGTDLSTVGTIQDVRVYNVILTPAEFATLESDGPQGAGVTRGLVFRGPCVKTADLAYFTDHTLVSTDRLIDDMYGARGIKSGTVVTRLP